MYKRQEKDRIEREALRVAADFLRAHPELLPDGAGTAHPAALAVLAVDAHDAFVGHHSGTGRAVVVTPAEEKVRSALGVPDGPNLPT